MAGTGARVRGSRLESLGRFAVRRRRFVLVATAVFALLAMALGGDVVGRLSNAGFSDTHSESNRAAAALESRFGVRVPQLVLRVAARGSVDEPAVAREGAALALRLAREPGVERVTSYWTSGAAGRALRSRDGRAALIEAEIAAGDDDIGDRVKQIAPRYRGRHGPVNVGITGTGELLDETTDQIRRDLAKAELIALPLTLLALFFVFRGLIAAALPLAIGGVSIAGTLLALRLITQVAPVSVFAVNIATALGLGLAIDYSLLIVGRYRDELRSGLDVPEAIAATMRTAGRTVLFSAVTVAVSLAGLLVFPMYFLRSFAYAGVSVVVIALLCALLLMPALLAVAGRRIDSLAPRQWQRTTAAEDTGLWFRLAQLTMRRPLPIATGAIVLLLALAAPFVHLAVGFIDDRNLPASAPARQVSDEIRRDFTLGEAGTVYVLAGRAPAGAALSGYAKALSQVRDVVAVDAAAGTYRDGRLVVPRPAGQRSRFADRAGAWLAVQGRPGPYTAAGEQLLRSVRAAPAPYPVEVTGLAARAADTKDQMLARLPIALAVIALTTFVALLILTGSVLVPIKALVMNALSLAATFGVLVHAFQDGHMHWLFGDFAVTGTLNVLNPPLLFCVVFGLSMDYEVFMLSRIREEHDRGRDTATAVARGLQRTGPVITAAAAVMAIVFASTATTGVTGVKMLSAGMAIAVLIDATVVRIALVPAVMRLAGRYNWWAPRPLRRLQARMGWVEGAAALAAAGAKA
jgi:putative drug exporter of the RND superfamily